jgi:hypothetical protein
MESGEPLATLPVSKVLPGALQQKHRRAQLPAMSLGTVAFHLAATGRIGFYRSGEGGRRSVGDNRRGAFLLSCATDASRMLQKYAYWTRTWHDLVRCAVQIGITRDSECHEYRRAFDGLTAESNFFRVATYGSRRLKIKMVGCLS